MSTIWNAADQTGSPTISGGGLTLDSTASFEIRSTTSKSSGKWYFEIIPTVDNSSSVCSIGLADGLFVLNTGSNMGSADADSVGYISFNGSSGQIDANSSSNTVLVSAYGNLDVIGVAVDVSNHLIYYSKNGSFVNSANPITGAGSVDYITTNPVFACFLLLDSGADAGCTANFGGSPFNSTPPAGYSPWDLVPTVFTLLPQSHF